MAVDALAPCVDKSITAFVSTVYDEQITIFHEDISQLPALYMKWKKMQKHFMFRQQIPHMMC